MKDSTGQFVAVVGKTEDSSHEKGGKFVVTYPPRSIFHNDTVTFNYTPEVFQEHVPGKKPKSGGFVVLEDVQGTTGGWRAGKVRKHRPEDDQVPELKVQSDELRKQYVKHKHAASRR